MSDFDSDDPQPTSIPFSTIVASSTRLRQCTFILVPNRLLFLLDSPEFFRNSLGWAERASEGGQESKNKTKQPKQGEPRVQADDLEAISDAARSLEVDLSVAGSLADGLEAKLSIAGSLDLPGVAECLETVCVGLGAWVLADIADSDEVLKAGLGFNIDSGLWKTLSDPAAGFGYQVVQRGPSNLLVSAPLEQYGKDKRGQIFECSTTNCNILGSAVLKAGLGFNIDSGLWKTLSDPAAGFGYQVVQRGPSNLLVSAPLEQYGKDKRGRIFECSTTNCNILGSAEKNAAVNMSLGLAMANDPSTQTTMVCGPTIPRDCKSITMYNGLCFEMDKQNTLGKSYTSVTGECPIQAYIAFLLDGSGSVSGEDFKSMKDFVKGLIRSFLGKDTRFAITQYSYDTTTHYDFNAFSQAPYWESQIDNISQKRGGTYTAAAIGKVVNDVFLPEKGSRSSAKKLLIVITDGESQDSGDLPAAASLADSKQIVRFAIGVGDAFSSYSATQELRTIASQPAENFMFKVGNFAALDKIRENLQDKIFSIEGSQTGGEALEEEMSQEGFRAVYVSGDIQMAMVGANQWRGGYKKYSLRTDSIKESFQPTSIEADSYLGYSMAVASTRFGPLTVIGAPRYEHRGVVWTVLNNVKRQEIHPYQPQSGEYFGAEVCAMDVDSDGTIDLILISAPMYTNNDGEGRVYVCELSYENVLCHFDRPPSIVVLRGSVSDRGRFGSSLAVLPDINADTFNDLAVGAPLENDGKGSIYIFQGEGGKKINPIYSQRIAASEIQPGLKLFGISISQSSYDQSGDGLPDLAVGSKGKVVLLRSRPVVTVTATVSFNPKQIPTQNPDCSKPLASKANICFTMSKLSAINEAQAQVNFTLTLDANRKIPNNRAWISKNVREKTGSLTLQLNKETCHNVDFFIEACPDDALNALNNELRFTFGGLPSGTKPRPSLSPKVQNTSFHSIGFEIICGKDGECVDDLKVDFNFTSSSVVKVGIDELLNVTVFVENRGENSYNSRIILTYPIGLSYRKFTSLQGRIECNSLDSEDGVTRGQTDCSVDKPIFKSNSVAVFVVAYGHNTNSKLERRIFVTANATSGNIKHISSTELYKINEIDVKYSIFITVKSSLSYNNFTFGEKDLQKPLKQEIKVANVIRALNFTVVIKVPVKLGDKDIWEDKSSFMIAGCVKDKDEEPGAIDFVRKIKESKILDCAVARCRVFRCSTFMERNTDQMYRISANISSRWIQQIGLSSAKFRLTSTASLEYDNNQYIFYSTTFNNDPPVRKIEAEIEVFPKPDFTKEIIGGSLGGLAFLALLTAGLYKAGFFKSKYSEMINESAGGEAAQEGEGVAPAEG
ncbi:integrin alpha-M [Fundulus heteroclitus]|uniref:integrin alpha-M n=1 Tax=Fundulus heteroclitus TaxID=8078 RepID=UPI00165C903C|nr:integrin alpha-M [Fundulus heteroclitus]